MKVLSIVIPVWNKWNFTKSCLEDMGRLPATHEIIIVDNGSSDETQTEMGKINNPNLVYQRNSQNLGFAKACNVGYGLATASNVLFLNNDIRVQNNHETWTQDLIRLSENAIVGPTMGQLDSEFNFKKEANQALTGNSYMSGWCICSSKKIWQQLEIPRQPGDSLTCPQLFSEEFGLAYFEDTDLGFRAKRLGIEHVVVPVPVVHFGQQTSKQLNTHKLYTEARQIFVKKWSKR